AYGLDSHFFSALPKECADASTNFEGKWVLESDDVFRVILPDPTTGTCVAGSVPVYRIFNNRPDANHRYTTDVSVRQQMIAKGGVPEGSGPDGVAFCTAVAPADANALSAAIWSAPIGSDMYSFSSIVVGLMAGATISSYAWDFGDGAAGSGAAVKHQFPAPGTYAVTLNVADNRGNRAS